MTWYVAITNPNCHRRAEAELASLGYRAFWPKLRKWVSHARTKVPKEYPILGRYLFVDVHDGNFWRVRNVNGIEGLVTFMNDDGFPQPVPVPEAAVMGFQLRYHAGEWDRVANERIPMGARVRVLKGEFARMLVVIRGTKNGKLKFLPPGRQNFAFTPEENVWAA